MAVDKMGDGQKLIVVGKRFAVTKTKKEANETTEDQQASFSKQQKKLMSVNAVSKARFTCSLSLRFQPWWNDPESNRKFGVQSLF